MKSIEEIKNEIAIKRGYDSFYHCAGVIGDIHDLDLVINDVAIEYAKQMCIEQRELCASHAKLLFHDGRTKIDKILTSKIYIIGCDNLMIYKQSITKTPLATDKH